MKKTLTLIIALFLHGFHCEGQELLTFDIIAGYGLPESFHVGFRIHAFEKSEFGLYYGTGLNSSDEESYNSLTIDHQYHFGRISELSQRQICFFRQGLTYAIDNQAYSKTKVLFINLSVGREFNISPKIALSGDLGLFRVLKENEIIKKGSWFDIRYKDFLALPVIRLQLKYSL